MTGDQLVSLTFALHAALRDAGLGECPMPMGVAPETHEEYDLAGDLVVHLRARDLTIAKRRSDAGRARRRR